MSLPEALTLDISLVYMRLFLRALALLPVRLDSETPECSDKRPLKASSTLVVSLEEADLPLQLLAQAAPPPSSSEAFSPVSCQQTPQLFLGPKFFDLGRGFLAAARVRFGLGEDGPSRFGSRTSGRRGRCKVGVRAASMVAVSRR